MQEVLHNSRSEPTTALSGRRRPRSRCWTSVVKPGGLTPVARLGGMETKILALKGKDGRNYTSGAWTRTRADPGRGLRGTIVDEGPRGRAGGPASGERSRRARPARGRGRPRPPWRLVVMPDDPALGGVPEGVRGDGGRVRRVPQRRVRVEPGLPGHHRDHRPLELYGDCGGRGRSGRHAGAPQGPPHGHLHGRLGPSPEAVALGSIPVEPLWEPIPEDRDQAFSRYEGLILAIGRARAPRLQKLGPRYPGIGGLTENGRDQDRRLLSGLTRDDYARRRPLFVRSSPTTRSTGRWRECRRSG